MQKAENDHIKKFVKVQPYLEFITIYIFTSFTMIFKKLILMYKRYSIILSLF